MPDYRDRFNGSSTDLEDLAEFANALYNSSGFEADLSEMIQDVLEDHAAEHGIDLDRTETEEFVEQLFKNGRGGAFMIRNGIATNADADLEQGDVVTRARRDGDGVDRFVVREARPDATYTPVWKVDPEDGHGVSSGHSLTPGCVMYSDRFDVNHDQRGLDAWTVAKELANTLSDREVMA